MPLSDWVGEPPSETVTPTTAESSTVETAVAEPTGSHDADATETLSTTEDSGTQDARPQEQVDTATAAVEAADAAGKADETIPAKPWSSDPRFQEDNAAYKLGKTLEGYVSKFGGEEGMRRMLDDLSAEVEKAGGVDAVYSSFSEKETQAAQEREQLARQAVREELTDLVAQQVEAEYEPSLIEDGYDKQSDPRGYQAELVKRAGAFYEARLSIANNNQDRREAAATQALTQYPNIAPFSFIVNEIRDNPSQTAEDVLRYAKELNDSATSYMATSQAPVMTELETLRAKVANHDTELAKAKSDAINEARIAIAAELAANKAVIPPEGSSAPEMGAGIESVAKNGWGGVLNFGRG